MWFARCASGASLGGLAPAGHASRHRRRPGSGRAPLRRRVPDREPASKRGVPAFRSIAAADDSAGADEDDAFPSGEDASPRWRVRRADASDADAVVRLAAAAGVEWSAAQVTEEVEKGNALVAVSAGNDARDDARADADGPRVSPSSSSARAATPTTPTPSSPVSSSHGSSPTWKSRSSRWRLVPRCGAGASPPRSCARRWTWRPPREARLECRASNAAARRLYVGLGFTETGARRRYYGDGEDAALLTRVAPVVSARELTRLLAGLSPEARARARAPHPRGEAEGRRHARAGLPARQAGVCAQPRRSATRSERRAARVPHAEQDTQVSGLRVAIVSRALL